jgi:hypothetical protein
MLPNAEGITARLLGGGDDDDDAREDDDGNIIMTNDNDNAQDKAMEEEHHPSEEKKEDEMITLTHSSSDRRRIEQFIASASVVPILQDYECEVSCINPRGRFLLRIYRHGIILIDPKQQDSKIIVDSQQNNVENVVIFRKPEEYKKLKASSGSGKGGKKGSLLSAAVGHMVLITLKEDDDDKTVEGIVYKDKRLTQICFQLPSYGATATTTVDEDGKSTSSSVLPTESHWKAGLLSAFGKNNTTTDNNNNNNDDDDSNDYHRKDCIIWVHSKMECVTDEGNKPYIFHSTSTLEGSTNSSSSTTEGLPYVSCYKGFNDGALFPLKEGLLFFKPPLFVHRSKLVSISCGRGGSGGGSSRYVDMIATLDDNDDDDDDDDGEDDVGTKKSTTKTKKKKEMILEFTNINRDELPGLNDYIHKVLIPAMKSDCANNDDDDGTMTTIRLLQ